MSQSSKWSVILLFLFMHYELGISRLVGRMINTLYVALYPVKIRVLIKTNCDLEDVFSNDDRLVK